MPGTLVAMFLNSPRMPSGAFGLLSHMSMVAGPPANHIMITLLALAAGAPPEAARASRLRKFGRVKPSSPADPTRRKSRRWTPSQSDRKPVLIGLVPFALIPQNRP